MAECRPVPISTIFQTSLIPNVVTNRISSVSTSLIPIPTVVSTTLVGGVVSAIPTTRTSTTSMVNVVTAISTTTLTSSSAISTIFSTSCPPPVPSTTAPVPSTTTTTNTPAPTVSSISTTSSSSVSSTSVVVPPTISTSSSVVPSTTPTRAPTSSTTTVLASVKSSSSSASSANGHTRNDNAGAATKGPSTAVLAGAIAGGVVILALIGILVYRYCIAGRRRNDKDQPFSNGFFGDKYTQDYDGSGGGSDGRGKEGGGQGSRFGVSASPIAAPGAYGSSTSHSFTSPQMTSGGVGRSKSKRHERQSSSGHRSDPAITPSSRNNNGAGMAGVGAYGHYDDEGRGNAKRKPSQGRNGGGGGQGKPQQTHKASQRFSISSNDLAAAAAGGHEGSPYEMNRNVDAGRQQWDSPSSRYGPDTAGGGDYYGALSPPAAAFAQTSHAMDAQSSGIYRSTSGAPTARSVPKLGPVDGSGQETRDASRGGLRVTNHERTPNAQHQHYNDQPSSFRGGNNGGGYQREAYDAQDLRSASGDDHDRLSYAKPWNQRDEEDDRYHQHEQEGGYDDDYAHRGGGGGGGDGGVHRMNDDESVYGDQPFQEGQEVEEVDDRQPDEGDETGWRTGWNQGTSGGLGGGGNYPNSNRRGTTFSGPSDLSPRCQPNHRQR